MCLQSSCRPSRRIRPPAAPRCPLWRGCRGAALRGSRALPLLCCCRLLLCPCPASASCSLCPCGACRRLSQFAGLAAAAACSLCRLPPAPRRALCSRAPCQPSRRLLRSPLAALLERRSASSDCVAHPAIAEQQTGTQRPKPKNQKPDTSLCSAAMRLLRNTPHKGARELAKQRRCQRRII